MMTTLRERIGLALQRQRQVHGLSQSQLARLAKLSLTYVGEIERGEANVRIDTLEQLTNALEWVSVRAAVAGAGHAARGRANPVARRVDAHAAPRADRDLPGCRRSMPRWSGAPLSRSRRRRTTAPSRCRRFGAAGHGAGASTTAAHCLTTTVRTDVRGASRRDRWWPLVVALSPERDSRSRDRLGVSRGNMALPPTLTPVDSLHPPVNAGTSHRGSHELTPTSVALLAFRPSTPERRGGAVRRRTETREKQVRPVGNDPHPSLPTRGSQNGVVPYWPDLRACNGKDTNLAAEPVGSPARESGEVASPAVTFRHRPLTCARIGRCFAACCRSNRKSLTRPHEPRQA